MNSIVPTTLTEIQNMVLSTVSERTRRDYRRALDDFMVWHVAHHHLGFSRAAVNGHIADLRAQGISASSINQRLAAIRKLAKEAWLNGFTTAEQYTAIKEVDNVKTAGRKTGNWLTVDQAQEMLDAPDTATVKGMRDRALLALMIGCGLRREEVASLTVEHLAERDSRWVILDLLGKHGRIRTVPIAPWVKVGIDAWLAMSGIDAGSLALRIRKGGTIMPTAMTPQAIWYMVEKYKPVDKLAPHDLRRTFAKLAHRGGSAIEQIQISLGHASIQTTQSYIGVDQDLQHAPSDAITLRLR